MLIDDNAMLNDNANAYLRFFHADVNLLLRFVQLNLATTKSMKDTENYNDMDLM